MTLFAFVACLAVLAAAHEPPGAPPGPVPEVAAAPSPSAVRFDGREHDFGTILSTDRPRHTFTFTNTGGAPVSIVTLRASCGCTIPKLDEERREYRPGERGTVTVEYEPKGKRGKDENTITIVTDEENRQPIELRVRAFVEPTVIFDPPSLKFDAIPRGTTPSLEVLVVGRTPDFRVNGASIAPDSTSVGVRVGPTKEVEYEGKVMRGAVLTFTVKPEAKVGPLALTAIVRTNDKREPLPSLRIAGDVVADIACDPPAVNYGAAPPGAMIEGEFTVYSRSRREFRILRVESPSADLAEFATVIKPSGPPPPPGAESDEREPADPERPIAHRVIFTARVPNEEGVVSGRFTIVTDRKDQPPIPLAFRVMMRKPSEPGH